MSNIFCLIAVSTVGDHHGPDYAIIEVAPEWIEELDKFSKSVAAMTEKPLQVEYLFSGVDFFNYGDVTFLDEGDGVLDSIIDTIDSVDGAGCQYAIVKDVPPVVIDKIRDADILSRYDLLTVVFCGSEPNRFRFSGHWKGTDISFVSRELTIDILKDHCKA